MRIERIIVEDEDIQAYGLLFKKYHGSQYQCVTDDLIVIGNESYRLITSSVQWDMVTIKRINKTLQIDILGTGGGSGLFSWSWGTERSFVREMTKRVMTFCEERGVECTIVSADEGVRKY